MKRILGYILGIGLLSLLLVYFNTKSMEPQLPDDPRALEALNMVKDYHSRQGGTIEEAIAQLLEDMEKQGKPYHKGVWRVASQSPDTFVVSLLIREKGETGWIERDYAWRVHVKEKWIRVITLPATHLMPLHELPPLPHSQEIS